MPGEDLVYGGGGDATILNPGGVDTQYVAPFTVLANEFSLSTIAPKQLAEEQDKAVFMLTVLGVESDQSKMAAVTLVFEPDMALSLLKAVRSKYKEIPLENR